MSLLPSLLAAAALASVHVFSTQLRVLREIPRSRFLSIAGGISVAFVVLRILPGISESQEAIERSAGAGLFPFLRHHAYLMVLVSILVFYGVARVVKQSRRMQRARGEEDGTTPAVFWVSIGTFAVVNFLIGYVLLDRWREGVQPLLLFTLALMLKFVVNDHGLYADHRRAYDRVGRWILVGAVFLGWWTGYVGGVPEAGVALLQAFIAGSILLNVLKEELPEERESRYWAFALGAGAYAALLLAL